MQNYGTEVLKLFDFKDLEEYSSSLYQLNFAVTYYCESRCKNCFIWTNGQKALENQMTLEEIEELSKNEKGFRWIRFTGGEPFLRKDLYDIIRSFYENSDNLSIVNSTTNSYDPVYILSVAKKISKLGIKNLIIGVSIDGYRELHNYVRGVDSFDNAVRLFKGLRQIGNVTPIFSYTVSIYNQGNFEKTFAGLREEIDDLSINDFNFNLYENSSIYYKNHKNNISKQNTVSLANEFMELDRKLNYDGEENVVQGVIREYANLVPAFLSSGQSPIDCDATRSTLYMDPYGNVYPCITWDKKLGNVRENGYSISNVLRKSTINEVRETIKDRKCPGCWTPCEAHPSIISELMRKESDP